VSRISVRTFVAFLILSPLLGWRYGAFGGAIALIVAEVVMLVWMALALWGRERQYVLSGLRPKA
jgi:O-antigen/teichoic acid export membrane protein